MSIATRFLTTLNRARSDTAGATAVEFAFLGPPLLLTLFMCLEVGFALYARSAAESVVQSVARVAITGNVKGVADRRGTAFEKLLRAEIEKVLYPGMTYKIEETVWDNLSQIAGSGIVNNASGGGASAQLVHYRLVLSYKIMTPLVGSIISKDGTLEMISSAFVKNEAF